VSYPEAENAIAEGPEPQLVYGHPVEEAEADHAVGVTEPAYQPPAPFIPRGFAPAASVLGLMLCGASVMAVEAQRNPMLDAAANPAPDAGVVSRPHEEIALAAPFVGPPYPVITSAPAGPMGAPDAMASAVQETFGPSQVSHSGLRGGIGITGPLVGPLNTDLSGATVRGPIYTGQPLPAIGGIMPRSEGAPQPGQTTPPGAPLVGTEAGSELPDAQKLALARLANPLKVTLPGAAKPAAPTTAAAPAVSAEKPLSVSLSVSSPRNGYEPGATVAVRASANVDAYFLVIAVDAQGNATTLVRSSSPGRSVGYAVRAQTEPGPEYVVALASVNPLTGGDAAAALRSYGSAFRMPVATVANAAAQPGSAWSAAVSHAAALGGGTKGWKRFEWALSPASFFTRQPVKVAVQQKAPEKAIAKPEANEGSSVLPAGPNSDMGAPAEKSVMPTPKPEGGQPKNPMAAPDPAKPAAKPADTNSTEPVK
jgi:hypothetical protein